MADLATLLSDRHSHSRGQLILLTAFALGAIFLGLALIANSAIFTENLATRNENVESTDALEYRYSVTQATGEIVAFANEYNHTSHDEITANVEQGIRDMSAYTGIQQVERGDAETRASRTLKRFEVSLSPGETWRQHHRPAIPWANGSVRVAYRLFGTEGDTPVTTVHRWVDDAATADD
jgi:hypothetical protein